MKALKIITIVVTALSIAVVVPILVIQMVKASAAKVNNYEFLIYGFFTLMVLNIAIGGLTLIRLDVNSKSYVFGVFTFLFVSPIAGILYLIWKPEKVIEETKNL